MEWSACSVPCDKGTQKRKRVCSAAVNDGKPCPPKLENRHLYQEIRDCQIKTCPDPMWTSWTISECSSPGNCGFGSKTKTRKCEDWLTQEPMDPYLDCGATSPLDISQSEKCENKPCVGRPFMIQPILEKVRIYRKALNCIRTYRIGS